MRGNRHLLGLARQQETARELWRLLLKELKFTNFISSSNLQSLVSVRSLINEFKEQSELNLKNLSGEVFYSIAEEIWSGEGVKSGVERG